MLLLLTFKHNNTTKNMMNKKVAFLALAMVMSGGSFAQNSAKGEKAKAYLVG